MPGKWLLGLAALAFLSTVAYCDDSRSETLEKLLVELRELREAERQESIQSRNEFRHLVFWPPRVPQE